MAAGSNKVAYGGREIPHLSTVILWFDGSSETKSITFLNFTGQNAEPKDIELRVHGLWDAKKASTEVKFSRCYR
jgi:hypothetical protein